MICPTTGLDEDDKKIVAADTVAHVNLYCNFFVQDPDQKAEIDPTMLALEGISEVDMTTTAAKRKLAVIAEWLRGVVSDFPGCALTARDQRADAKAKKLR